MPVREECEALEALAELIHDLWADWALHHQSTIPATDPRVRQFLVEHSIDALDSLRQADRILAIMALTNKTVCACEKLRTVIAALLREQMRQWLDHQLARASREAYERWLLLAHTPYFMLSNEEQEKDRTWARRYLDLLTQHQGCRRRRQLPSE